jgi:hypothetical protein
MKRVSSSILFASILAAIAIAAPAMAQTYPLYVTGAFDGWTGTGPVMTLVSGVPGSTAIWQATVNMPVGRNEFKITEGDWGWSQPGSGNGWTYTDGAGNTTITYDQNTYADGWSPASGRLSVNIDPGTWTAVGDWQSQVSAGNWNNAEPLTAMLSLGGGIYEYSATLTPGTYQYKAVDTGSWDAIGADGLSANAGTLLFTTTVADPGVNMYVNALNGTVMAEVVPEPTTVTLVGFGLLGALALCRRKA